MKRKYIIYLLPLLLTTCRQEQSQPPLEFTAYDHNPVLIHGEPGSWDEIYMACPFIVRHAEIFYLFYQGLNTNGIKAIGVATSDDGYHFTKYGSNPVLKPDGHGFDAYGIGQPVVVKNDSGWVMYYNAMDRVGFGAGAAIGRATASSLPGPWIKSDGPVLTSGNLGEWDSEFLKIGSVLVLEDRTYIMFFTGGTDWYSQTEMLLGMATSKDGIKWHKYNDPATTQHPYADSDPILLPGKSGDWDSEGILAGCVIACESGLELYYSGFHGQGNEQVSSIGYAYSENGTHWKKYPGNPVFKRDDDPYPLREGGFPTVENPALFINDTNCYMYYDYGIDQPGISLAIVVGGLSRGTK